MDAEIRTVGKKSSQGLWVDVFFQFHIHCRGWDAINFIVKCVFNLISNVSSA